MSLKEIGNGVVLGNRIGMSVLVEGALGWAMLDDWIKVPNGEERGQKQKEMKKSFVFSGLQNGEKVMLKNQLMIYNALNN